MLDLDEAGPAFGQTALAALSAEGRPLRGSDIVFRHFRYDGAQVESLKGALTEAQDPGALVICSSEGGLSEYGSDDEITSNLAVLRLFRKRWRSSLMNQRTSKLAPLPQR